MTTPARSQSSAAPGGADLLRSLSLFVDGPVLWGHPVPAAKPGVFVVELPAPQPTVAIDPNAVRAWLERVPDLRLDGKRPTVGELQARLAGFWLPAQTVLYVGAATKSIGSRLAGMYKTPLGDRRPQPAGYWLKTLHDLPKARIWWAETDDAELYEDAAIDAFVAAAGEMPFAVLSTPSGRRKAHGLTAPLREVEEIAAGPKLSPAEARSKELAASRAARLGLPVSAVGGSEPDREAARRAEARAVRTPKPSPTTAAATGAATGAAAGAAGAAARTTTRRTAAKPAATRASAAPPATQPAAAPRTGRTPAAPPPTEPPQYVSSAGLEQIQAELDRLTSVDRPQVIARIKAARELGDLSENADYEAARKEQSFLEGRILQLEQLLKQAVVIDESQLGHHVTMGSTVVVDSDKHGQETFTLVGSIEADAAAGKISYTSPIGKALMGKRAGDKVRVEVPAGAMEFKVVEVR